ncbi:hypothetical protein J5N97_000999 [Dioscorea zingiberensis]|uniref:Dolichol phosphate-mannose biosynthesis regulatory protein n=1 Tax=Dioscorea zingiberensis TaxID=325984 RepID=A0A9D5BUM5_9LILI|nr:hypothetical protein J5N97_000999 [Dioscorea zingiberensis]
MELADKAVGCFLSAISLYPFSSTTPSGLLFWYDLLLFLFDLMPFVESDHFIHGYFLPQEFAILIPVFAGVALLSILCVFVGYVMLKSKAKKKKQT